MDDASHNPRAVIGGNEPPVETPTDPFDAISVHLDDLYTEAGNWADGQEIENEDQAAVVERLIKDFGDAIKLAEATRDKAIEPLNDQIKVIRERWYPLIADTTKLKGKAIRARTALLAVKTKWANKLDAARAAEAERLRQEALAKAAEARAQLQSAPDNLEVAEAAEDLIRDAQRDLRASKQAEKPATKGMRTVVNVVVTDEATAMRTMWLRRRDDLLAYVLQLAEQEARMGGVRTLDGFTITESKEAFR